jgi:Flp pilus assembly pilin Flp
MHFGANASWRVMRLILAELAGPRGRQGQDLVEYALMAGFLAVTVAAVIPYQVTAPVSGIFSKIQVYLGTWGNG